ncbi:MAG: hypothetical protein JWN36_767 [Microbacteriaceae bacterium]|nr:hypothetical protein [Microbacteriaceae bacterium]
MRKILILVALVALLSACSAAAPTSTPSKSSSPQAHSSPSASPVAGKPTLGDLVISPDGLGPLVMGEPVPSQSADLAIVRFDPALCKETIEQSGATFVPGAAGTGGWVTTYSDPHAFYLFTSGADASGPVTFVGASAWESGTSPIHTATGIHPGSSTEELKAAYSSFDSVTSYDFTDIYAIKGERGVMVFEVSPHTDRSGMFAPGDLDRVLSIRVAASSVSDTAQTGPIYATDSFGSCV